MCMYTDLLFRRRLFKPGQSGGNNSNDADSPLEAVKRNIQLCLLQLSQAMPLAMQQGLIAITLIWWPASLFKCICEYNKENPPSMNEIIWYNQFTALGYVRNFLDGFVHSSHFYLFVSFSKGFRAGFAKRFSKWVLRKQETELASSTLFTRTSTQK